MTEHKRLAFEPEMVVVPSGPFLMGTREKDLEELFVLMEKEKKGMAYEQRLREAPQFEFHLPSYEISRFPVTNSEYAAFISDGGFAPPRAWAANAPFPEFASHPVVNVSWSDAIAYCAWLSKRSGTSYRLPSEPEWEKAAAGIEGWRYPWGNTWDANRCNNVETGEKRTTAVGKFSPGGDSPFGCCDMIGNVWEWCSSRYGGTGVTPKFKYPYDSKDAREDLNADDTRILRGGSFFNGRGRARCQYRGVGEMSRRNDHTGFRCARSLPN